MTYIFLFFRFSRPVNFLSTRLICFKPVPSSVFWNNRTSTSESDLLTYFLKPRSSHSREFWFRLSLLDSPLSYLLSVSVFYPFSLDVCGVLGIAPSLWLYYKNPRQGLKCVCLSVFSWTSTHLDSIQVLNILTQYKVKLYSWKEAKRRKTHLMIWFEFK